ncbi:4-carboxy-4-hydroxy-2-oxoadipate aldolase/oxaloacetate decarboxylase [Brevibacillus fulvus]|uniref:Putative 4-hydroxy-4-methyl-2-oxoglutarate aldolase n=1 Tax=Brevibacillus fulvus TaxID=1125967 RepID=A0A939BP22_9BACL|nr:4-carboxy-4-hydroxy-2-oxoadipate aldolase/oxaloacetate decarboxylase [Brevibacillus fulvus]MBM7589935.1 4-hydroxy-4-methyl-2-oxoglutarate aldolase [Brevibacillus fulvus]
MEKYVRRNIARPDSAMIAQYAALDTSTVYEAQGRTGLMNHSLKPVIEGRAICGPAVTAICHAGDNLMIHAAIEVCQPGDILVVTTIGESVHGMIGELIVRALIKRGVQGVVIDAGIRDAAKIRELGFPVWSKAIHSLGTTKTRGGWVNAPTVCAGVQVGPGDLLLADDDGVVVVRQEDLQTSLEAAQKRVQKEEDTKAKIERGELSLDFYGLREILSKENVRYFED